MAKCKKCDKEAIEGSSGKLCEKCWIKLWVDGFEPLTKKQRKEMVKETRELIRKQEAKRNKNKKKK